MIRAISAKRNEPEWMLNFRLDAFQHWLGMEEPHWLKAKYPQLDYQDYSYYSAPSCGSCDDTCGSQRRCKARRQFPTSEVEEAFEKLGVPVREGQAVAVDAIFDSVSVSTTYRDELKTRRDFLLVRSDSRLSGTGAEIPRYRGIQSR